MVYNLKITWLGYVILIVILNSCTSKYEILSLESGIHEIIPSTKNLNNQSSQEEYNLEIISKYEEVEIKVLDSTRSITHLLLGSYLSALILNLTASYLSLNLANHTYIPNLIFLLL